MNGDRRAGDDDDAVRTIERRDGNSDDVATLLGRVADLTHGQHRMDLDLRRLDLDMQRLDATVQLMGTSVCSLRDDVKQLGTLVQRLETRLDLNQRLMDFHLHTIMNHIGVPPVDTFHSTYDDGPPTDDRRSAPPGEAGG